jgi:hypothetical protein
MRFSIGSNKALSGKFFVLVTMSLLIIVVALCLVLTPVPVFTLSYRAD